MSDRTNTGSLASGSELDARLKRIDEPRWLASRYAPFHQRLGLVVLSLVYNDLARVRFATEPMLGRIRLQWWREAVAELKDGKQPRRHDLVAALAETVTASSPAFPAIEALIDAFDASLSDDGDSNASSVPEWSTPGSVMAEAAGRFLNSEITSDQSDILRRAGVFDERGATNVVPTRDEFAALRSQLRRLEPAFWPAVAHLAAYNPQGVQLGQFHARWRVFWAILTRTI